MLRCCCCCCCKAVFGYYLNKLHVVAATRRYNTTRTFSALVSVFTSPHITPLLLPCAPFRVAAQHRQRVVEVVEMVIGSLFWAMR